MRERNRKILSGLGATSITIGVLILLFVSYQLWGTGFFTAREQSRLKREFAERVARLNASSTTVPPTTTSTADPNTPTTKPPSTDVVSNAKLPAINEGDAIGMIHLPWSEYAIIQGTSRDDLKKGPGHYPATPFPGQLGNAAVAGHRTTYLHPFGDLDTLHRGSQFTLDMLWGHYTYRVVTEPFAVKPNDTSVVVTTDNAHGWLTLTTCNPKYSASQRLIVRAELVVGESAPPQVYTPPAGLKPGQTPANSSDLLQQGLEGNVASRGAAIIWGYFVVMVGLAWWIVYRHWRHPATWFAGLVPFLPVLFVFYVYLERLLPNGY